MLQRQMAQPGLSNLSTLRTLVLKLRWIGMEDEADNLYSHLIRIAPGDGAGLCRMAPD